eukprot:GEMP01114986.1.p1 GENE.GEMP01114986.1~~GEMP01114986.1.p1  ORF type:complete len:174 (+),score=39.05 GEMP01114986.1:98-619(+)
MGLGSQWAQPCPTIHKGKKTLQVTVTRDMDCILFQNFYTHSLSIALQSDGPTPIFSTQLMEVCHAENDAQAWHAIYANQFNPGLPPDVSAVTLEFTLKQPSPMWVDKDFSIRSLQGYVFHRTSTECGCSTPDEEEETFVSLVRRYRLGVEGFVADKPRGIADYCELSEVALEM